MDPVVIVLNHGSSGAITEPVLDSVPDVVVEAKTAVELNSGFAYLSSKDSYAVYSFQQTLWGTFPIHR